MGLLRTIRTVWELAARVNELQLRFEYLELEWVDKKDAFELLLKRLATRDSRARRDDGDVARSTSTDLPANADKSSLREVARARGLIR